MKTETKKNLDRRLASAAGHLKGIQRMVSEDQYCIEVIKQVQAVQAALDKVKTIILDEHLHTCVSAAIRGDDADERERMLAEVTSVFELK